MKQPVYVIQRKILNFSRWYNFSNETNESDRRDDALEGIRYYFAHVINDVCIFRLPYLVIYFFIYFIYFFYPFCLIYLQGPIHTKKKRKRR